MHQLLLILLVAVQNDVKVKAVGNGSLLMISYLSYPLNEKSGPEAGYIVVNLALPELGYTDYAAFPVVRFSLEDALDKSAPLTQLGKRAIIPPGGPGQQSGINEFMTIGIFRCRCFHYRLADFFVPATLKYKLRSTIEMYSTENGKFETHTLHFSDEVIYGTPWSATGANVHIDPTHPDLPAWR